MLKYGLVTEYKDGKAKVRFPDDEIVTDWLAIIYPFTQENKKFHPLTTNEQVACMMDENAETGIILGSIYSDSDAIPSETGANEIGVKFKDGVVISYNTSTHKLKITGSFDSLEINGDLKVTGKIDATGNIETSTGDVKSATVSLNNHQHTGVTVGPGVTGTPLPTP